MMEIPSGFIENIKDMMGDSCTAFINALNKEPEISIKLNKRKVRSPEVLGYEGLEPVKWCSSGFYLPERPKFTLNPLMHAGAFYVQDASSMIYEAIIDKIIPAAFDSGNPVTILDMCAAPGGKTTSIINAVPDGTHIVANEFIPARAMILKENLIKWGYRDIIVTNSPTKAFRKLSEMFDIVAVDAPCSGEGMMRKDDIARNQWNKGLIRQCSTLQREILHDASETLKPGGFLIYSTCTYNHTEDEDNAQWIADELGLVPFNLEFPEEWGIAGGIDTDIPCMRFMPHVTRGEGLFVAVFRKEGEYVPAARSIKDLPGTIGKNVKMICSGIPETMMKGRDMIAAPESVFATDFDPVQYPEAEVSLDDALTYLRHQPLKLPSDTKKGLVVIKYRGVSLGFVNNIGNRANNLYPKNWRIKNL